MRFDTELRIAAVRREMSDLKALIKARMHDRAAISAITQKLRILNNELIELEQSLRTSQR